MMRPLNPAYPIVLAAILIASWPDGTTTRTPATTLDACEAAVSAYQRGIALPDGQLRPPLSVRCQPATPAEAGFPPDWDCIHGFNCPTDRRPRP